MIFDETPLTFSAAARSLPGRPHPSTIWRWHRVGVRGIRLEAVRLGGRYITSQEALDRFAARLSESDDIRGGAKPDRPPARADRQRAIERAEAACAKAGI